MNKYIKAIIEKLNAEYPDADCTLSYSDPLQLLVATQLAAQCTDVRVNIVMEDLVVKYPDVYAYATADLEELTEYVRTTGFFRNKAKNIIGTCRKIVSDFGGEVPQSMAELLTLPGVGRKTANLVLGDAFDVPGIVVDTHAGRLARRMGLTEHADPYRVELDLLKIIPKEMQTKFCHQLVSHGRKYCRSQRPLCVDCPLGNVCRKVGF